MLTDSLLDLESGGKSDGAPVVGGTGCTGTLVNLSPDDVPQPILPEEVLQVLPRDLVVELNCRPRE